MKGIKERFAIIGLIAFAIGFFWMVLEILTDVGSTAANLSGAENSWGFQWVANNLGWLTFIAIIIALVGFILWSIKARRN